MIDRLSALFSSSDMTVGNPMTCLLRFSIPLLIGNLAQQLYSTVDSIVVGQYVGDKALSAIGTTLPIINLLLVLFIAISTGTSIMVAQYFGAREKRLLSHSVGNAITLILLSSVIIMVIGIPLSSPLLELTNTPVETFDMAHSYLVIILAGVFFSGLYNILSGVLRGLGNSVYPLFVLLIASVLNIFLDIWFVAGLEMGVGGAALATIISQAVSAVLCLFKLVRMKDTLVIDKSTLTPNRDLISQLMRLGLPAGITQVIFSMSMVFVQSLTNSMGYKVVTCTTAVMRIDGFAMMPNFTFGMAIATFVGQNIGAQKTDRIKQAIRISELIGITIALVSTIGVHVMAEKIINLFTSDVEIIDIGVQYLQIVSLFYVIYSLQEVIQGVAIGSGHTLILMISTIVAMWIVRIPIAFFLSEHIGITGIWLSIPSGWFVAMIFTNAFYLSGRWKHVAAQG